MWKLPEVYWFRWYRLLVIYRRYFCRVWFTDLSLPPSSLVVLLRLPCFLYEKVLWDSQMGHRPELKSRLFSLLNCLEFFRNTLNIVFRVSFLFFFRNQSKTIFFNFEEGIKRRKNLTRRVFRDEIIFRFLRSSKDFFLSREYIGGGKSEEDLVKYVFSYVFFPIAPCSRGKTIIISCFHRYCILHSRRALVFVYEIFFIPSHRSSAVLITKREKFHRRMKSI